ncbi:MAG: hypothetical protein JXR48_02465 [Candidatus Delongbacteria bacterium]|nr:hypothetical protein [Candidatus Delongbacteria bacterium]MBN2833810.1 hypothetical protein [Candidatus Delongbacteria bacterium]
MKKFTLVILLLSLFSVKADFDFDFDFDWFDDMFVWNGNYDELMDLQKTIPVENGMSLIVDNFNGSIKIDTWQEDSVYVHVMIRATDEEEFEKVKIEADVDDNSVFVKSKRLKKNVRASISYELKVPPYIRIDKLSTNNGAIDVSKINNDVKAETSNGAISLTEIDGVVSASTSNGTITVRKCRSVKELDTSNGKIVCEVYEIERDITLDTSNGSISLGLAQNVDVDLDLDTSNGSISIDDLDVDYITKKKTYVKATIGRGGNRIIADTSNGSIRVYRL